jgi:predicted transcriptional regulator
MSKKLVKLSDIDMVIVKVLKKNSSMQTKDFVAETSLTVRQIRNSLKKLKKINVVVSKEDLYDTRKRYYHYNPEVITISTETEE